MYGQVLYFMEAWDDDIIQPEDRQTWQLAKSLLFDLVLACTRNPKPETRNPEQYEILDPHARQRTGRQDSRGSFSAGRQCCQVGT